MYSIARGSSEERGILFENTAAKKGINAAIVEKDFWVVLTLEYLFKHSPWQKNLAFKGGTSLSKAYGLIERFSEDIDLILDWRLLGYTKDEPWGNMSRTKLDRFIEEAHKREKDFLRDTFTPRLQSELTDLIGESANVYFFENPVKPDEYYVCFEYPGNYHDPSILRAIRLEVGALASWTPTQLVSFSSYAAEEYPGVFSNGSTAVLTTTAERTFWEKVTILHREAMKPADKDVSPRYSRHYYDLYCMSKTSICKNALGQPELLTKVAKFKDRFYHQGWARYDLAKIGTVRLIPSEKNMSALRSDYADMKPMIYGNYPSFDEVMDTISELEERINKPINT